MKPYLVAGTLMLTLPALGQQPPKEGLTRNKVKKVVATSAPVTQAEARAAFVRAERVIRSAVGIGGVPNTRSAGSKQPVTRAEVVEEFARLYTLVLPKAKITPRPVRFDAARLKIAGSQREKLIRLVRAGAIAPVGPVAAGPKDTLTVAEFGDALGYFLSRMAEITYLPSRRWTPDLQDE